MLQRSPTALRDSYRNGTYCECFNFSHILNLATLAFEKLPILISILSNTPHESSVRIWLFIETVSYLCTVPSTERVWCIKVSSRASMSIHVHAMVLACHWSVLIWHYWEICSHPVIESFFADQFYIKYFPGGNDRPENISQWPSSLSTLIWPTLFPITGRLSICERKVVIRVE